MFSLSQRNTLSGSRSATLSRLSVLFAIFVAAWIGPYLVTHGLSYRQIIVALMALLGVTAVLAGDRGVYIGFFLWIWTLGLGYRTVEVTRYLRIHPSEALLWGLFVLLVVQQGVLRRERLRGGLPRWLWLLVPFLLWGWVPGILTGRPWDRMLTEFRNFLLFIPLFAVATNVLHDQERWRSIILAFYGTGTWIAGMGVVEFLFPDIRNLFPGFIASSTVTVTNEEFLRALYTFWGTPAATFICLLSLPLALALWAWYSRPLPRLLILVTLVLQLIGIYIGGYRSIWLLVALEFMLLLWLKVGPVYSLLSTPFLLGLYRSLTTYVSTETRLATLLLALEGQLVGNIEGVRWTRLVKALKSISAHPLGRGWAGAGWVHNDFVQIAANLGLLAGLIFLAWYLTTLNAFRSRHQANASSAPLRLPLLLSFVGAGGILALNAVVVLPQLVLPVWLVWVLAEVWLRQREILEAER